MNLGLLAVTAVPAAFISDVGVVLDYKGAVFGGVVALLLPGWIFLRVAPKASSLGEVEATPWPVDAPSPRRVALVARALVGVAVVISGTGFVATTAKLLLVDEGGA